MFRFSCFHSPAHSLKPKKTVKLSTEAMQKTLEDHNTNKPYKDPVFSKEVHEGDNANPFPSPAGQDGKSEGLKSRNDTDSEHNQESRGMRKCVSLGAGLAAYQDMTSGDYSSSSYGNRSGHEYQNTRASVSPQISSNMVNHASDLSLDRLPRSDDEVGDNSETRLSGSSSRTPCAPHAFVKSNSLPYMHLAHTNVVDKLIDNNANETFLEHEVESDNVDHADKSDGDEEYDYAGSAKDWIVPPVDEAGKGKSVQEDYSGCQWEGLPNEDFKIRRIEKWIMDLQHSSSLEETETLTDLDHHGQNDNNTTLDSIPASKNDAKSVLGMDAAKRYISSLNAAATSAQLANHGLVVIPFLSAFSSLRALNLSGNSIVRITVGALPRGLHILNLSKNSISTIEGLRELTKLRVLDLSYNRILRIGHGLAACSSLKELYLAGNKISEVEGLHRLLKLSVLDLRFNKLSTTKSLGQLAANYNSLQAISLEGNPAQKNIGDEQLRKIVIGLLPNIAYFNRQSIKSGSLKDSADRTARHGISAHQVDRGLRSESKKSTHGRRGRNVRLPPSGVKAIGDRHQFPDVSSQLVSFRPDLAMRRAHSEGLLRAV
ncbi:putative leucine-rich repeat domain superfamily [Helianthus debilis subsp. tardiflorus]